MKNKKCVECFKEFILLFDSEETRCPECTRKVLRNVKVGRKLSANKSSTWKLSGNKTEGSRKRYFPGLR